MIRLAISLLVFGASVLRVCEGYGSGAPPQACVYMTPGHLVNSNQSNPIPPQGGVAPYTVTLDKEVYGPGEELQLTLSGTESFVGFLLQARPAGEDEPVGGFELQAKMKTIPECSSDYENGAITHTDTSPWTSEGFNVTWTAPDKDVGEVTFYATVATNHDVFWVKLTSDSITYSGFEALSPTVYMLLLPIAIVVSRLM